MSRRFSVLTSYTLSKNKDHAGESKQTGTTQTNPSDLEFDWGYSNADRRHRFVTSFLWQIPGEFDNPVVSSLLSDWSLTGILAMQSGGWLHRHERCRQRAHRHGQSTRRHLGRSRPADRSSQSGEDPPLVRHVGLLSECAGDVRQFPAQRAARTWNEERRSRPAQDVRHGRRHQNAGAHRGLQRVQLGEPGDIRTPAQNSPNFGRITHWRPAFRHA